MLQDKLNNFKNKFTERANTLFTSMKDEDDEEIKYEIFSEEEKE